jgi:hypothetical protein
LENTADIANPGVVASALKANAIQPQAVNIEFIQAKNLEAQGASKATSLLKSGR